MSIKRLAAIGAMTFLGMVSVAVPALAAAPANDNFRHRIFVPSIPFTHAESTAEATTATDDPPTTCFAPQSTVWFSYRAGTSRRVLASTIGSQYDTTLAVFTGRRGALTQVVCNDDAAASVSSVVRFDAVAGRTYHFMLGTCCGGGTGGGQLVFNLRRPGPPASVDVNVLGGAADHITGLATIRGVLTCTNGLNSDAFLALTVRQVVDGFAARGSDSTAGRCDGTAHSWAIVVESVTDRAFVPGLASVTANATSCDDLACAEEEQVKRISLRRR
ncbi:MAG: hypothetical protein QOJ13_2757 [Gaiellales bacterium]|jgi:hypothetical protein|nr:hypothetical protein [Gaiellales bacterium]